MARTLQPNVLTIFINKILLTPHLCFTKVMKMGKKQKKTKATCLEIMPSVSPVVWYGVLEK